MRAQLMLSILAAVVVLAPGCAREQRGGPRVPTFPIRGKVLVDGEPAATLKVECHALQPNPELPLIPSALTSPEGKFEIATYEGGDGAPAGEYHVVFIWGEYNLMNGTYGGDKLKKKYADPKTSDFKVTVIDKPVDLGEIQLTTK